MEGPIKAVFGNLPALGETGLSHHLSLIHHDVNESVVVLLNNEVGKNFISPCRIEVNNDIRPGADDKGILGWSG
jgi:hypothetical protein